jgi:hypothetical protein
MSKETALPNRCNPGLAVVGVVIVRATHVSKEVIQSRVMKRYSQDSL